MTSYGILDLFKRKRSETSSESSNTTPEKETNRKKKVKHTSGDKDITEETDSVLVDLEDSITMDELGKESDSVQIDLKDVLNRFDDQFVHKIKGFREEILNLVTETLQQVSNDIVTLKKKVETLEEENSNLKQAVVELRNAQTDLKIRMNDAAQHSRKDNVRILGLQETPKEDTRAAVCQMIHRKLNLEIKPSDIAACHRLPSAIIDKPKPIIVRFKDRYSKEKVTRERKQLKGSGVTITDDITQDNLKLMNRAKLSGKFESVWYFNGKVKAVRNSDAKKVNLELFQTFS